MLKYIKIKNINSIGECEIDFKKDKYKYLEDNLIGDYVNPIALYGHNGSGKSTLLRAMGYLISLLINPVDNLQPFIVNQFILNKYNETRDEKYLIGSIELHFSIDEINYEYFISVSRLNRITREYLKTDNLIFDRTIQNENYRGKEEKINNLRSLLVPSIRYFASEKVNDKDIQSVYSYLTSFTFVDLPNQARGSFVTSKHFANMSQIELMVNKSQEVENILKDYKEFPLYNIVKVENKNINGLRYFIKFDNLDDVIPFEFISTGMLNQSTLLSILVSLPNNSVLFIDELEQALHPSAILSFIKVVKSKKMQLVFSSHNTFILQSLRPDQVYFANWNDGLSSFYRLSKIYPNIREINNIEKMYLSSIFDEAIKNGK